MSKKSNVKVNEVPVVIESPVKGVKTGRKINPNSVRQKRLAELELKRANGGLHRGRPVNGDSVRQKRLAEMKARAELNGGVIKRGRPAKPAEVVAEVTLEVVA